MNVTATDGGATFSQVIEDFLNLLLEEGGMVDLSPDVKAEMITSLRSRLNERLFATLISNLPDEKVSELRTIVEGGQNTGQLEQFIDENIPESREIFAGALLTFRNDYLGIS